MCWPDLGLELCGLSRRTFYNPSDLQPRVSSLGCLCGEQRRAPVFLDSVLYSLTVRNGSWVRRRRLELPLYGPNATSADPGLHCRAAEATRHVALGQGAAPARPEEPYVQGRIDGHPGVALRDLEASRDALSRQENSTPGKGKDG